MPVTVDPRNNVRSLDRELKQKISGPGSVSIRRLLLNRLHPSELLHEMSPPVFNGTKVPERIIRKEINDGRRSAVGMFLDEIPAYSGWSIALLDALHSTGFNDIALKLHSGYTPPNDEDDNGHGHGNDAIPQGGNGYYGNFISQGRDAYGNFRNPNGASTSHFREGPRDSNSTLTKNLLRNSNAANSTLTPGPNEPPPPYTETPTRLPQLFSGTAPKPTEIPDIFSRTDADQGNYLEKCNRDRQRLFPNVSRVTDCCNTSVDGGSQEHSQSFYIVGNTPADVEPERAVAVDCTRNQHSTCNSNEQGSDNFSSISSQNPSIDSSNSATISQNSTISTEVGSQSLADNFSQLSITGVQSSSSSDSSSSNSDSDSLDDALRPPANDLSPNTMLNIDHSTCYTSNDTTSVNDITQSSHLKDETKSSLDDKSDQKSKDYSYFYSVTERLYDCSFNTRDPENEFATLTDKDILYSKSSSGPCDKLDEEVVEIIDEGEVLTSNASPEQECNLKDLINFDSKEVLHPPASRYQVRMSPQEISCSESATRQSDICSVIRAENPPVNGRNQSASQEVASLATSTVDEDHFDNPTCSENLRGELNLMNENSYHRIKTDSNTSNAAIANSNNATKNSSNGDNGDSGNGNNDFPSLLRSTLRTGAAALLYYDNISRFMK